MTTRAMTMACLQLNSGDDVHANWQQIKPLLERAHGDGAELIALPENAFFLRSDGKRTIPPWTMDDHPGLQWCREWLANHPCYLLIGSLAVRDGEEPRHYNRSILFNPKGEIAAQYDKLHLFDAELSNGESYCESKDYAPGCHASAVPLPCGMLGMSVCYDLRFPKLFRDLACAGANVLAIPSAFTRKTGEAHWHVLLRARAIETGCYVLAPAQVGTHGGGRQTYGHAMIVGPWGDIIVEAGNTDTGLVMTSIDPKRVEEVRAQLPTLCHARDYRLDVAASK